MRQLVLPRRMTSPGLRVDGEVLVERGDLYAFGLQDDVVEGGVGDGAAVGDGDHAGAAAWVEVVLHAVAEEVGAVAAAAGFDAFVRRVRGRRMLSRVRLR
jgi:hypothetical protein